MKLTPRIIRLVRVLNGFTLKEVSKETGVPVSTLSNIERGLSPFEGSEFEQKFVQLFELDSQQIEQIEKLVNEVKGRRPLNGRAFVN